MRRLILLAVIAVLLECCTVSTIPKRFPCHCGDPRPGRHVPRR